MLLPAVLLTVTLILSGCAAAEPKTQTAYVLDTICQVTVYDKNADEQILDDALAICSEREQLWSRTVETSDVGKLNAANGEWVTVSEDTAKLLSSALSVCEKSGGAFDITIAAASELWDFASDDPAVPDAKALAEAVRTVDYRNVEMNGLKVRLKNGAKLDLGGVAKGAIADEMGAFLRDRGVKSALIDLGGNILAVGKKPDGTDFRIGLQKPFAERGELMAVADAADCTLVTSGSYERHFEKDGEEYHHLLDSKTGYPAKSGLQSVTVIGEDSLTADALSTACFILGEDKALVLLKDYPGVEAVFVREDGKIVETEGLEQSGRITFK